MAITIVNSTGNFNAALVTSISTSALATSAGNLLVAAVRSGLSQAVTSITDTAGNTYTLDRTLTSNGTSFEYWYCLSASAHASNVITANFAGSTTNNSILVAQIAGMTTATLYTDLAHAALYPAALTANAKVGIQNQILIVATQIDATGTTWTPGPGFTTLDQDNGHVVYMEYAIATSTLVRLVPAATLGGAYSGILIGALFGDASGGGGGSAGGSYGFA